MTNSFLKAFLVFFFLLISSCGYELPQKGVVIHDEAYTRIAIPTFHNATFTSGLETDVTKALRQSVIDNGAFQLTSREDADIILHGDITGLSRTLLALNPAGSGTEYRLKLSIRFNLKRSYDNEPIYKDNVSSTWDYKSTIDTIDTSLSRSEVISNLSKELSQEILLLIRERFSHNSRN